MDALLCSLHRVASEVHEEVEATRRSAAEQPPHIVDLAPQFESRARQIRLLRHLHAGLLEILAAVARYGSAADALHRDESRAILAQARAARPAGQRAPDGRRREAPDGGRREAPGGRRGEAPSGRRGETPWKDQALTARALRLPPPAGPLERRRVALTDRIGLDALIVPAEVRDPRAILAAVAAPELHYVARWNHFAFRVGAVVFHGNVGRVFPAGTAGRALARVKACRRGGACPSLSGGPPCAYYHDPAVAGGADVRNFTAASWLYAPAASLARAGSRRIGSREALEGDLQAVSASEARRHLAQAAHDVVVAMVLAKYVLGRAAPEKARRRRGSSA